MVHRFPSKRITFQTIDKLKCNRVVRLPTLNYRQINKIKCILHTKNGRVLIRKQVWLISNKRYRLNTNLNQNISHTKIQPSRKHKKTNMTNIVHRNIAIKKSKD